MRGIIRHLWWSVVYHGATIPVTTWRKLWKRNYQRLPKFLFKCHIEKPERRINVGYIVKADIGMTRLSHDDYYKFPSTARSFNLLSKRNYRKYNDDRIPVTVSVLSPSMGTLSGEIEVIIDTEDGPLSGTYNPISRLYPGLNTFTYFVRVQ